MQHRAIVLLSGGMDSATALAMAQARGIDCVALTFAYGQRHWRELDAAREIAKHFHIAEHRVVDIDLRSIGGSALTDAKMPIPNRRPLDEIGRDIPSTYVPARNLIFLSYAVGLAETIHADAIVIAANAIDYSGYPDCRPEFFAAFREVIRLGTRQGIEALAVDIDTPLIAMRKSEIVRKGEELHVPWNLTWSCYRGESTPCATCDSCQLRSEGFREVGVRDPLAHGR